MCLKSPYRNYLFNPNYWKLGFKHPRRAWLTFLAIIKHPLLYLRVSRKVEGFISHYLGVLLYESVLKAESTSPNIVEIGAFKGLSTIYFSFAAGKATKKLYCFESFCGLPVRDAILDPDFRTGQFKSKVEEFETNVKTFGDWSVVNLIIGDARQTLLPALENKGFCVAFIDVDVYEVMKDLLFKLWSAVRGNEIIIIHDVNSPGVRKAIDEFHILTQHIVKEIILEDGYTVRLQVPSQVLLNLVPHTAGGG